MSNPHAKRAARSALARKRALPSVLEQRYVDELEEAGDDPEKIKRAYFRLYTSLLVFFSGLGLTTRSFLEAQTVTYVAGRFAELSAGLSSPLLRNIILATASQRAQSLSVEKAPTQAALAEAAANPVNALGHLTNEEKKELFRSWAQIEESSGGGAKGLADLTSGEIEQVTLVQAGRSSVEIIARDQALKLAAKFNEALLRAEGDMFTWVTMRDDRVRPMHAALDGRIFRWDDPPVTNSRGEKNLPGGDYLCRCVAVLAQSDKTPGT